MGVRTASSEVQSVVSTPSIVSMVLLAFCESGLPRLVNTELATSRRIGKFLGNLQVNRNSTA